MPYADPIAQELYRRRYAKSERGRELHRARQSRYRERNRASPSVQRLRRALSAWGNRL